MPACFAASMMVVPLGTLTGEPSIVTVTNSSAITVVSHRCHCRLSGALNVRFEFVAELLNAAHDGCCAGVAQHTDCLAGHVIREVQQELEMFLLSFPCQDALQDPHRPRRSLPALSALGARFVGIEPRQSPDLVHHI